MLVLLISTWSGKEAHFWTYAVRLLRRTCALSLTAPPLALLSPPIVRTSRANKMFVFTPGLDRFFLCNFVLQLYLASHKLWHLLSLQAVVDIVTVPPSYAILIMNVSF